MTTSPVPCPTASQLLRSAGACIDPADAALLLAHALRRPRAWLYAHATDPVAGALAAEFEGLVARRAAGEPVAYLTGRRGFWTLELAVTPDTLIPRPETELLVEQVLVRIPPGGPARVADLGTGSGAIALAIACERPLARVVATDISRRALAAAAANAGTHGIGNVEFRQGDWWSPLAGERFDVVASNPPYIADDDPHLQRGDLRFEPRGALASGRDGLEAIGMIVRDAPAHLAPGGWLLLEHGHTQGEAVRALLRSAGFVAIATERDLEGRERVTAGRSPGLAEAG
ncbi:peptide chain release factor N(5)-glutamine methyltransferase [Luteimonas sp. R10]|uniref:peptide chain release factor N(5)-glutamine methyltransferase n=1 Tax=Luteimonas sp. R10 TaxID=3108176 RepID=UPI00308470C8|nr:peptide chain release factor N(5)-glutamine methyltransferase [Luteimonas sp. R10]